MPEIKVSEGISVRIREFKQVVEAVLKEEITESDYVTLILQQGIDSMMADLLGSLDPSILLRSFQQLGWQHPTQTYGYIAEMLKKGAAIQQQEQLRRKLGFLPPGEGASES